MNTKTTAQAQAEPTTEPPLPPLSLSLEEINRDLYQTTLIAPEKAPVAATQPAPEAKAPETTENPQHETATETPIDTPKAEEQVAPADEKPTQDAESKLPERIRTSQFSEIEKEALALRHRLKEAGEDVPSIKEAIELVEVLREKNKPAPSPAVAAIEQRNTLDAERTTAETELSEVMEKLDQLAEAESPINRDFLSLQDRKNALNRRLENIQGRHDARIASVRGESRASAIEMYPSAADASSALGRQINADIAEMRTNVHHPDRALLTLENAPEAIAAYSANKVATQIAKEQGSTKVAALQTLMAKPPEAKAPAKETTAAPTTQTRKVAPVSGAASTKTEAPKPEPWNAADPKTFQPEAYDDLYKGNKGLIFRL